MLVLTRRVNEEIVIADIIRIRVLDAQYGRVRIGVAAPLDIRIDRLEVAERRANSTASQLVATAGAEVD
jgi:carbon storage regulator